MKNTPAFFLILFLIIQSCDSISQKNTTQESAKQLEEIISPSNMKKIEIEATDGLKVTADLYRNSNPNAKWMLLCHQARYSRGEYIETALNFVKMGYSCLVLDQRSGDAVNNVTNETKIRAKNEGKETEYKDALPDVVGAMKYLSSDIGVKHLMIVGSSYSSSLAIIMAAKYPEEIDAIACFSPGNYFTIDQKEVSDFAKEVTIPTFITSAKNEGAQWKEIFENVQSIEKTSFLPNSEGFHGSKALWSQSEGNEEYQNALKAFLDQYFPS